MFTAGQIIRVTALRRNSRNETITTKRLEVCRVLEDGRTIVRTSSASHYGQINFAHTGLLLTKVGTTRPTSYEIHTINS